MDGLNRPEPLRLTGNLEDNWKKFKRDYDLYMIASGKRAQPKAVQAATFLNLIGSDAMEVFETLDVSEDDKEDPDKIIAAFQKYVEPQRNEMYERFLFINRKRHRGEKLEHYVSDLKRIAKNCNYGALTDSLIRDNIIYHMSDRGLQQSALKSQNLELESLIKMIKMHEIVRSQTREIEGSTMQRINAIHISTNREIDTMSVEDRPTGIPAYRSRVEISEHYRARSASRINEVYTCQRCNGSHGPYVCPAFGARCQKCLKYNHTAEACKSVEFSGDGNREKLGSDHDNMDLGY